MPNYQTRNRQVSESVLPWIVLIILLIYTYAAFFKLPYVGFDFNPMTGQIVEVFVETAPETGLAQNDVILKIETLPWDSFRKDASQTFFKGVRPGQIVPIEIQRGSQSWVVSWQVPGFTRLEFFDRLINVWWLAYVLWIAGTATLAFVRPRDLRRALLVAAFYLTAIWLIAGNISAWQVWKSALVMRMATWLSVPVYLHLHWVFPKPFRRIPTGLLWVGYGIATGLAIAEWFQLLPRNVYFLGFLLAVTGTILFLLLHFIRQPRERKEVGLLVVAAAVAFLPSIVVSVWGLLGAFPRIGAIALLALPAFPGAYFYATYRHQLSGLELRTNRVISAYLFMILLGTALFLLIPLMNSWFQFEGVSTFVSVLAALLAALLAMVGFPGFSRFVERNLLGMPLPPTQLLETYSSRIATSLTSANLVHLLKDEILPSLLVRQSVLLWTVDHQKVVPLYTDQVETSQIPTAVEIKELLARKGKDHPLVQLRPEQPGSSWIRLSFPLDVEDRLVGVWLLGNRDPDNLYTQPEISILQTMAHQVALSLVNIAQAESLRALFEANIERAESERTALARELHDEVLNQLAILLTGRGMRQLSSAHQEAYQVLIERLRRMISGLRPAMLTYGLGPALDELIDDLRERVGDDELTLESEIQSSLVRYPPRVEEHLYRIVQQACENALRHSQAREIRIYGQLEPEVILTIADNGVGLHDFARLDIHELIAQKHFGLVGLMERAAIIDADVQIDSQPGIGTKVLVTWHSDSAREVAD